MPEAAKYAFWPTRLFFGFAGGHEERGKAEAAWKEGNKLAAVGHYVLAGINDLAGVSGVAEGIGDFVTCVQGSQYFAAQQAAEAGVASSIHSGEIAARSNEVSRESIIRALRQSNTAEGTTYAKMIKRGIVNLKIEKSHPKGYGGLYPFGTKDVYVYTDVACTPQAAAGITAHEITHYLQELTCSTYRKLHEIEAFVVEAKVDPSFPLRTLDAIRKFVDTNPAYRHLKP